MTFDLLKLNEYKQAWKSDPYSFMKEMIGLDLAPHQKNMLNMIVKHDLVTVKSANSVGKSTLLSAIALWFFFCYHVDDKDNVIVLFTAPTFAQVRENIYNPIRAFIDQIDEKLEQAYNNLSPSQKQLFGNKPPKFVPNLSEDKKQAEIRIGKKNYILGVSTEGENKNVGKHGTYVLCIFDEAQGIDDAKMSDFEGITISGEIIKQVFIGNTTLPQGLNGPFYRSFQKGSEYKQISIPCFETINFILPNIKAEDYIREEKDPLYWRNKLDKFCGLNYYKYKEDDNISQWERDAKQALKPWSKWLVNPIAVYKIFKKYGSSLDSYEFRTRCLAEFPKDSEQAVFPQEWINNSMESYFSEELWQRGNIVMGIDVAQGTGADNSAISIRNGNKIIFCEVFNLKLFELLDKIEELYHQFDVESINIETDAIGRDKYLMLEQRGLPVCGIQAGGGAGLQNSEFVEDKEKQARLKKEFAGKRDEIWWNLRELMAPYRPEMEETKGEYPILLPQKEMLRQELSAVTYEPVPKVKIASKKQIKSILNRSPDLLDSVILAFANSDDFYSGGNISMISVAPSIQRPRF